MTSTVCETPSISWIVTRQDRTRLVLRFTNRNSSKFQTRKRPILFSSNASCTRRRIARVFAVARLGEPITRTVSPGLSFNGLPMFSPSSGSNRNRLDEASFRGTDQSGNDACAIHDDVVHGVRRNLLTAPRAFRWTLHRIPLQIEYGVGRSSR